MMGAKSAAWGLLMTVWTFISMVIIPLSTLKALENGIVLQGTHVRIILTTLNIGLIFLLGLIAMVLTASSYAFDNKGRAVAMFLKYLIVAYYEWVWAIGVRELTVIMENYKIYAGIDLGIWIIIVILGSLLQGILKSFHEYAKALKKEEEEEKEEE